MKILLTVIFLLFEGHFINPKMVYYCGNKKTGKYHYRANCRGLSNCTYRIVKTTEDEAKKNGKTLCRFEQ
ncbi:hypothetical protein KXD93_22230 [Mucilaginibacter sp. BJC16-A38]|uniref:hypothetical protein n=1 Tax=Mucilaginibacter phenanthrenivorans TaxID=1234842 RepID=UPI002157A9BB|nr:hypothetical protein [Mucilaginibacter phenanthrenivorans]MCR8560388.1 hypothetical protein [Mucilaginibacter phenanthrenivorans]